MSLLRTLLELLLRRCTAIRLDTRCMLSGCRASTFRVRTPLQLLASDRTGLLDTARTLCSLLLHTRRSCTLLASRLLCCTLTLLDTLDTRPILRASSVLLDTPSCLLGSDTRSRPRTVRTAGLLTPHSVRLSRCSCLRPVPGSYRSDTECMLWLLRLTQTLLRTRSVPLRVSDSSGRRDTCCMSRLLH